MNDAKEFKGNDLAYQILQQIEPFTCFPAILLETQCKKHGKAVASVQPEDIPVLAEAIEKAITAFGNPQKGLAARGKVLDLAK
jgi:hypothetical protein